MKNQSPYQEIPLAKKIEFLSYAIKQYEDNENNDWDGMCVMFQKWAKIRRWTNLRFMFPELWKEIKKDLNKTGSYFIIKYVDACKGRIRLLKRVQKQLVK